MIDPNEFASSVRTGLYGVFFAAAARSDANEEQLVRLRATADLPGGDIYERTGDIGPLIAEIQEAMGADWAPSGEWAEKIDELGLGK